MHATYALRMTTIQIRNVPERVSRALKSRAAAQGQSLSDYLLREVTVLAELPTLAELADRLDTLVPPAAVPPAAEALRRERAAAGRGS